MPEATPRPGGPVSLTVPLGEGDAADFSRLLQRLTDGLGRAGIRLEPRPAGRVTDGDQPVGRVTAADVRNGLELELRPATWIDSPVVRVRADLEDRPTGRALRLELLGVGPLLGDGRDDLVDWAAGVLFPTVVRTLGPGPLGDWVTDRRARRPSGAASVAIYRDPTFHWPNFLLILERLRLAPNDRLLEVGCGGGAFLHRALDSGCTAVGIDPSPDMLATARAANREAIAGGRVEILEGLADRLPVPDGAFTCCVCTGAFNFFPDPARALAEMRRALAPGGRVAVFTGSAALRGTPAAPEPIASRLSFYDPPTLVRLARDAGFADVQVEEPDLEPYARRAGVPAEALDLFRGSGTAYLLLARAPAGGPTEAAPAAAEDRFPRTFRLRDGRTAILRRTRPDDAAGVIALINRVGAEKRYILTETFRMTLEQERAFLTSLDPASSLFYLAEIDGQVVATANFDRGRRPKGWHTASMGIGLRDDVRGQGLGRAMMDAGLAWARAEGVRKVTLGVFASNERAIRFYRALGFREEGRLHHQFVIEGAPVDEVLMARWLEPFGRRGDAAHGRERRPRRAIASRRRTGTPSARGGRPTHGPSARPDPAARPRGRPPSRGTRRRRRGPAARVGPWPGTA